MTRVNEFRNLIMSEHTSNYLAISPWTGSNRRSEHFLEIRKSIVLYIKESNSSPGFWGLTKNQLDQLNDAQVCWYAILLLRSNDTGYILSSNEVKSRVQDGTFELSRDGDYKVNERTDLDPNMAFKGIKNLLDQVS